MQPGPRDSVIYSLKVKSVSAINSSRCSSQVAAEPAAQWGIAGWVNSLALTEVVAEALKEPPGTDPFKYVCNLSLADLESKLDAVKLSGHAEILWSAIEKLRGQSAATGAALNAKFAAEGDAFKGEMGFGGVEQFYGGVLHDSSLPILPALSHTDSPHRPLSRPREAHRAAAHGERLAPQGHGDGALRREGCGSAV